jgi:cytochrome c-type biogenesis protein CcmF
VFVIGVTMVKGYETERDVRMAPGQTVSEGGYEFKFDKIADAPGPNYSSIEGTFTVRKSGDVAAILKPEKRRYFASGQTMTEAAINPGFTRDVYVALGEPVEGATDGAWGVRIYVKPFINWIWGGCLLMSLGGILALMDRRYRLKVRVRQPELSAPVAPSGTAPAVATAKSKRRTGSSKVDPQAAR